MLAQELFAELIADGIEFNGDIEFKDDNTLVWSLKHEEIKEEPVEEDGETDVEEPLDALIEAYEEDIDYVYELLDEYDIDFADFEEADDFEFDGENLSVEIYVFEEEDIEL